MNIGLEYILMFSKNPAIRFNAVFKPASEERQAKGYWKGFWNNADRPIMRYDILGFTPEEGQWKWRKELAYEAIDNYNEYCKKYMNQLSLEDFWLQTGKSKKFIRRTSSRNGKNSGVECWIPPADGILRNTNWSDLLASKPNDVNVPFDSPKNHEVIIELLKLSHSDQEDSLVLDFFSGSATTAHAVMQLNAEDGGRRKFIMVQLPELCAPDTEAAKAGYENICEIGKERIRRAGEKIKQDNLKKRITGSGND